MIALLLPFLTGLPAAAATLGLAWGVIAETAETAQPGTFTPGQVAEHLEFLQAHGWQAVRSGGLANPAGTTNSVLLSFDDPASALRYAVPLLELYRMPAVVTVGPSQAADPAVAPVLKSLAASPWIELLPRVEPDPAAPATAAGHESDRPTRIAEALEEAHRLWLRAEKQPPLGRHRQCRIHETPAEPLALIVRIDKDLAHASEEVPVRQHAHGANQPVAIPGPETHTPLERRGCLVHVVVARPHTLHQREKSLGCETRVVDSEARHSRISGALTIQDDVRCLPWNSLAP
jgi:hypothetical protein